MTSFYGTAAASKFRSPLEEFEAPGKPNLGGVVRRQESRAAESQGARPFSEPAAASSSSPVLCSTNGHATVAEDIADEWGKPAPTVQDVTVTAASEIGTAIGLSTPTSCQGSVAGKGLRDLRLVSFHEWLLMVDPSAALLAYETVLEENYDSVAQMVKTYMVPAKGGRRVLDTQFFEDVGAVSDQDQDAFLRWFMRESGASGLPQVAHHTASVRLSQEQDGAAPTVVAPSCAAQSSNLDLRSCSFREWLEQIAPGGDLLQYLDALEDNFDTVAQIARTYVVDSNGVKILDVQFFEDICASSSSHQNLFRRWFEIACGVQHGQH